MIPDSMRFKMADYVTSQVLIVALAHRMTLKHHSNTTGKLGPHRVSSSPFTPRAWVDLVAANCGIRTVICPEPAPRVMSPYNYCPWFMSALENRGVSRSGLSSPEVRMEHQIPYRAEPTPQRLESLG
ncbi:hypothetical protein RRG08_038225 [Elysia crispata]|uniref:Uncharacterized protein n=1 Tax=Elysia crispata TaxID=231223 RepID=A0AAE1AMX4_9GAST|nr:hypothetical protein RRG08_038225 [Elysia crispata]